MFSHDQNIFSVNLLATFCPTDKSQILYSLLCACYKRLPSKASFLLWPFTVLMRQTRQALYSIYKCQRRHGSQHDDIQHNDTKHNNKYNVIISIMTLSITAEHCYAECRLCWVSLMLSATCKHSCAECCYAECRYGECHGAMSRPLMRPTCLITPT